MNDGAVSQLPPSKRYFDLIDATLRHALIARRISALPASGVPMECALLAVAAELRITLDETYGDLLRERVAQATDDSIFVDGLGHCRPMYRGLALQTLARRQPSARGRPSKTMRDNVETFAVGTEPLLAADASEIVAAIFDAWAIFATRDDDHASAKQSFARLVAAQQPDGSFLARTSSDNPEPFWYVELALLHAVQSYSVDANDEDAREAARRSARYHAAEVQPDHASNQPWAIAALLAEPDGVPLADTMLHAAGVQEPATMDAISLLLLADALRCGRRRDGR